MAAIITDIVFSRDKQTVTVKQRGSTICMTYLYLDENERTVYFHENGIKKVWIKVRVNDSFVDSNNTSEKQQSR